MSEQFFDALVEATGRVAALMVLQDKLNEMHRTDKKCCGNCEHWMKSSECPAERNIGGYTRGPSCDDFTCDQYLLKPWVIELKNKRKADCISFALEHKIN